jgi:hypothetical protein
MVKAMKPNNWTMMMKKKKKTEMMRQRIMKSTKQKILGDSA